ncbi:acyl-CoA dehydrogenase [Streptomyces abyssalis]|uniref:Acyl-CoA dehydrogenase n=1 Tax=Streptomyces abyssalis TaxID=933944 RepID=A0A1E7JSE4_9ACTN|nr:acyl-CoA dehydrogenase family protein [Streptomyces abyssalis]OEU91777.1 acyl-CoA dehydrogenase [Streptomyces abyssalis]OEU94084.1 acyl-CoA dehydrogenase [Streptomyces abyssalis]OEV31044.1 acyl-CoA dehydrogenase [Streptomyces nanshensis]
MSTSHVTEDHERLRLQVREFAETKVAPRVAEMESSAAVEQELAELIAKQGWIGVTIDPAYGGMGAGHLAKTIVIEEISRVSGAMGAMVQASQLGVAKVIHFGSERQKQDWLPRFADGSCLPTIAVTEPGSGGHVLGMEATARREGGDYVLNGRKVFVGNSHVGDVHGFVVRTGPGARGLSAFLVESDRPGLSLTPHQQAMGLHGFSFGELVLDDCRIPAANLVGEEGDGLAVAYSSSILYGRPNLTAVSLGIHQAIMEETTRFVQERRRYGGPLADLPTVRHKIGLMQSRLMTARLTAYDAVHLLDEGKPCDAELMHAKYINVEAALDSSRTAMEIHAAAGLQTDRPLERLVRDAYHTYAPAGTGDIQVHRLAETALGTSRGQWSQRLAPQASARRLGVA